MAMPGAGELHGKGHLRSSAAGSIRLPARTSLPSHVGARCCSKNLTRPTRPGFNQLMFPSACFLSLSVNCNRPPDRSRLSLLTTTAAEPISPVVFVAQQRHHRLASLPLDAEDRQFDLVVVLGLQPVARRS